MDAILEAAARILKVSDYDKSTTNRIAERAGVSIGSLYQYFPGKEALLSALLERQVNKNLAGVKALFEAATRLPLEEAIEELCQGLVQLFITDATYFKKLFLIAPFLGRAEVIIDSRKKAESLFFEFLGTQRPEVSPERNAAQAFIAVHAIMGVIQFCGLAGMPAGWTRARLASELQDLVRRFLL